MLLCPKCIPNLASFSKVQGIRKYSLCCPPRPSPCGASGRGSGRKVVPPADCRPGPIPYNPCVPRFHHGKDTWKKYKYLALFFMFPIILIQMFRALGNELPHKDVCRDYEYMRMRSKRYPWGSGVETYFHNPHVNHLPGECKEPPLICD